MTPIEWMNRNYGTVVSGGVGIVGAALVGFGVSILGSVGGIENELGHLKETDSALRAEVQAFRAEAKARFDTLGATLDTNALRQILIATGSVTEKDVFYAANRSDGLWVFPGDPALLESLNAKGLALEQFTPLVAGYKVLPPDVVLDLQGYPAQSPDENPDQQGEGIPDLKRLDAVPPAKFSPN